ncbi:MAG: PAS domain-containing hybrid sensor histidine kinase/response regulator [Desulfobulbaceae bacterium]
MYLSLSRKILLAFAILISFSLVQGLFLYSALHRFQDYNRDIHLVRGFQFVIHLLESTANSGFGAGPSSTEQFDKGFREGKELLTRMDGLEDRLAQKEQVHLLEAGEYLDNYRQAYLELSELHGKTSSLHKEALNLYYAIEQGHITLPPEISSQLFPLLLELYSIEEEVLDDHDVTLVPELKKLAEQIAALTSESSIIGPVRALTNVAEQSYLNSLALQERAVFFQDTAAHFYTFTDEILAALDRDIDRMQRRLTWLMGGLLVSALLLCLLLYLAARSYFMTFLRNQRTAITAIEQGRYDYPLPANLPGDELGDLARFTKEMAGSLQQSAEEIRTSQLRLRESEEHIRLILNSAAEAIYGLDREGCCTFCNRSMLDILGFADEAELRGKNIHDIIHHHYPDGNTYPWEQCMGHHSFIQGRETHSDNEVFFRRDGSSFPAECWSHPIRSNGEVSGAVVTFIDITQRKTAMQALRNSEQLYRTLIENIDLGINLIDKEYTIIMSNSAQGRLVGRDPADLRGKKCFREFTKKEQVCVPCHGATAMATRRPQEAITTAGVREDGSPLCVRVKAFPVFDDQESVSGFIEVVEDVSHKLEAERELAEEKERLAVTLRSIGDGVIATDTAGRIVLINKVAEELCGWSLAEATGRPVHEVFRIISEKTGDPCESPVDKALATGMIVNLANHTLLIARDGTLHAIADSGAPIRDRDSRIIGVVLVFRDVTEKNRIEEELFKSKKLESIGILAGGIAHDFNNILSAILGNINLVRHIIAPGEKRAHTFLEEAEKASLRAQGLTQQLLTFSKGGEPVRKTASIIEIIKDSTEFVLRGSGIKYIYDLPPDLWPVDVDPGQISQVMQNLVLNARHSMPGGGTLRVGCRNVRPEEDKPPILEQGRRFVMVDLTDTGIGIPANIIDNIFDPYFSTKKEGSGLGLSICHSIIDKHQGYIAVRSEQGKGSVFTFYLPAAEPAAVPEQQAAHGEQALAAHDMTVLVMDDDEQVRTIAAAMLSHLGCRVLLTEDGEEALAVYRAQMESGQPVGAVIMDLTIPGGMGGREAVRELLKIDPTARVIVSSGYSTDPVMAHYNEHGFCGAIVKPYQLQELSRAITQAIAAGRT